MKKESLLLLMVSILAVSCGGEQQAPGGSVYEALTVQKCDQVVSSEYSASIKGKSDIAVIPQVSGYITKVCVTEGQKVRKGEQLFIIDQVSYQAAYETAQANVSIAEANVQTAKLTYDSKKELFAQDVISRFDLATSENALAAAEAQLKLARAQARDAANNLSYTVVRSPSDGVVGTLPYKEGALVGPSLPTPLTTVSDNTRMYVYFSMTENQLLSLLREYESVEAAITSMPEVELRLSDGSIFPEPGRIESISGVIDQVTGAVSLRAVYPNKGGLLHSGGSGRVVMPLLRNDVFVIPKSSTFEIQDKVYVYKVVDGIATSTLIAVNTVSLPDSYIVENGLSEGDTIIAEGVGFIRDGMPVDLKPEEQS